MAIGEELLELEVTSTEVVDSAPMPAPSQAEFRKLVERVDKMEKQPIPWVQAHPTTAWLLSLGITLAAIFASLFIGILPHIENDLNLRIKDQVTSSLQETNRSINDVSVRTYDIQGQLEFLIPLLRDESKKKIHEISGLTGRQFESQLPELGAALDVASQKQVELEGEDLQKINKTIVGMVSNSTHPSSPVWETFVQLAHYRSYVNAKDDPNYGKPAHPSASAPVTIEPNPTGPIVADLTVIGGTQVIDGVTWQNVVFRDSVIKYNGGMINLQNVKFENCRFLMEVSTPTIKFGKELLAANSITFKQPVS